MIVGMHAPDGFLDPSVAAAMAIVAAIVLGKALRASEVELGDRRVPLAGVCAAFIFAAQMVNFPVASGTTGHLLGGALAAILLGPWVGSLVVAIVVVVQHVSTHRGMSCEIVEILTLHGCMRSEGLVMLCLREMGKD